MAWTDIILWTKNQYATNDTNDVIQNKASIK